MDLIIFEDDIKYDDWVKPLLALPLIVLMILGILFYMDGHYSNIFPNEPPRESRIAYIVVCFSLVFVSAVYWLFLPTKINVCQEGIRVKFGGFSWNIRFQTIESVKAAKGLFVRYGLSLITSYKSQIVIIRKYGLKIRISPSQRDLFLESANRALADWRCTHQPGGTSG
jgi:hypothetical protein